MNTGENVLFERTAGSDIPDLSIFTREMDSIAHELERLMEQAEQQRSSFMQVLESSARPVFSIPELESFFNHSQSV